MNSDELSLRFKDLANNTSEIKIEIPIRMQELLQKVIKSNYFATAASRHRMVIDPFTL